MTKNEKVIFLHELKEISLEIKNIQAKLNILADVALNIKKGRNKK